jgi:hypothetical protein
MRHTPPAGLALLIALLLSTGPVAPHAVAQEPAGGAKPAPPGAPAAAGPAAAATATDGADGFVPLFNGKDLTGWVQRGGKAKYRVENNAVVGTTVPGTPNTFLCTTKDYGDFILELEFKVDPSMNSGVQIRSNIYDQEKKYTGKVKDKTGKEEEKEIKVPAGRVHGYQVEIDPSSRAWTGGIYDEGRRGWLFDLKEKPDAQKAFKQGEWNAFRVECKGDSIKTWLNGVPAADLTDSMTRSGFIALQVHSVGKEQTEPKEVAWRNIRVKELN